MFTVNKIFLFLAFFGGTIFAVRIVLYFLGVVGHDDISLCDDATASDSPQDSFNVFNLHNISAFCLIGGMVGYGCCEGGFSVAVSCLLAMLAGSLAVFILIKVLLWARRLQCDGTVNLQQAVGQTAVVYLSIHPQTGGQVQVRVQGRLITVNAYTQKTETIPTGTIVRIIEAKGDQVVVENITDADTSCHN